MKFKAIEKKWDREFSKLSNKFEKICEQRIREIIYFLATRKRIIITNIIMGMGTWTLSGKDFRAIYSDNSESDISLQEIIYWIEGKNGLSNEKYWHPKGITKLEIEALDELYNSCCWWVEATGGKDITVAY